MSLDAREPPGGDFVAYIEQLERAQAARQSSPGTMVAPPPGTNARLTPSQAEAVAEALLQTPGPPGRARGPAPPAPRLGASQQPTALSAEQAQQLLARLNAGGQAGPSLVAILVGIGLIIVGGAMNAGPVPFFLGVAAIVWGARRLERLKKSKP